MRPVLLILAAAFCLGLHSCEAPPDKRLLQYLNNQGFGKRYTGNAEEEDYVTIGDQVSFVDSLHPELRGNDRVGLDGTITVPEVGAVHVAGMTRSEIEALLTTKLAPYYDRNDITVLLQTIGGKTYWMLGEVPLKGPRPFPGDLTIFEAVMLARPTEATANLGRVRLIRADPREPLIFTVNVNDMLRTGDSTYNIHVQESDIIVVPPTMLAQVGYFLVGLISPVTTVVSAIAGSVFQLLRLTQGNFGVGGRRGGRFNNNNNGFF